MIHIKSSFKTQYLIEKSNPKDLNSLNLHPQSCWISTYFPQSKQFKMRQYKHIEQNFNFDDKDETQRIDWFFQIGIEQMSQGCNFWFSLTWKRKNEGKKSKKKSPWKSLQRFETAQMERKFGKQLHFIVRLLKTISQHISDGSFSVQKIDIQYRPRSAMSKKSFLVKRSNQLFVNLSIAWQMSKYHSPRHVDCSPLIQLLIHVYLKYHMT